MTHALVPTAVSAADKMIRRATTCSDSSCFREMNVITPAIPMLHFKSQKEIVSLQG